jgi:hypothetical protein
MPDGKRSATCSCTRISLRRRIILTKTGQQRQVNRWQTNLNQLLTIKTYVMFFLHLHAHNLSARSEEHLLVQLHEPPHDTSEGGEFLDDAIRMEELPVIQTEVSIAAGSSDNLLLRSMIAFR